MSGQTRCTECMCGCAGEPEGPGGESATLVYCMACSQLSTQPEVIARDLPGTGADMQFLAAQSAFVDKLGNASASAAVFSSLCLPAVDADHLDLTLPANPVRTCGHAC
jgi:hypothetical protein